MKAKVEDMEFQATVESWQNSEQFSNQITRNKNLRRAAAIACSLPSYESLDKSSVASKSKL
jgi:hypothetical protein